MIKDLQKIVKQWLKIALNHKEKRTACESSSPRYTNLNKLRFTVAAENFYELVAYDFFDGQTRGPEVLTGVEVRGVILEVLSDSRGDSHTDI